MPERHEKLAQAIGLILSLAATRYGRSMTELTAELDCGRRTVERLFAAIRQTGIPIEEMPGDAREKRWRVAPNRLLGAVRMSAEEVAEIEAAAKRLTKAGLPTRAALLHGAATKLRAMMDEASRRRAELDVEAILASEGLVARPGPRVQIADGVVETLRQALLASHRVKVLYRTADGTARERLLEPAGLVHGDRPYLLAAQVGKKEPAIWRLDRIAAAEKTDAPFTPRPEHAVEAVMRDRFGVWQEPPVDVVLRFAASAARDAEAWVFHASQATETQPDGTLLVRFHAGGLREMAFHLANWGDSVEVLAPDALRAELAALGAALVRRHG